MRAHLLQHAGIDRTPVEMPHARDAAHRRSDRRQIVIPVVFPVAHDDDTLALDPGVR